MGGSSPRVRGTVRPFHTKIRILRFIPACAGNSASPEMIEDTTPVHPRVCGEQSETFTKSASPFGSSPRVRGTDDRRARIMI